MQEGQETRNPHEWSQQDRRVPPVKPVPYLFSTAANLPLRVDGAEEESVTQSVNNLPVTPSYDSQIY